VVSVGTSLIVDGDTNDPLNDLVLNDTISVNGSQAVPNPSTVGGFLGVTSSWTDTRDVYQVQMAAGQSATLLMADPSANDFDLYLYDSTGTLLDSSEGVGKAELVSASSNGLYLIEVYGYSIDFESDQGGLYSLLIGERTASMAFDPADKISSLHPFVEGEVLAQFKPQAAAAQARGIQAMGLEMLNNGNNAGGFQRLRITAEKSKQLRQARQARTAGGDISHAASPTIHMVKQLRKRDDVICAQPNYIRSASTVPNDEFYRHQWHYRTIGLEDAWDITTGSSSVVVAVVDTGVVLSHPDLSGQLTSGYDFISSLSTSLDGDGIDANANDPGDSTSPGVPSSFHGTHVAGTIAARSNNTTGVSGVAWNTTIMPIRVLGLGGQGTDYDIAQGIRYAAGVSNDSGTVPANPADIINMSLGGPGFSQVIQNATNAALAAGSILIAASGNENASADNSFPASLDGVVSVGAVDQNLNRAPYSNYGQTVDICAPGGNLQDDADGDGLSDGVLSTIKNGDGEAAYAFYEGTSMATPHVAGVVALMKAVNPSLTALDFDQLLAGTHGQTSIRIVDDLGPAGRDNSFGYGMINALPAVQAASAIAGGSAITTPILRVSPVDVSLGSTLTNASVTVTNGGGGTLTVTSVSSSDSWLTVSPGSGSTGTYSISVSRTGLSDGVYSGTVTFTSDGGTDTVKVRMSVGSVQVGDGDIGTIYVLLVNPDTYETVEQYNATPASGYAFSFSEVAADEYLLYAGTDMDNDSFIDNEGEALGGYPVISAIELLDLNTSLSDVIFSASYRVNIQVPSAANNDTASEESSPSFRLKRLR
jgi:serine protease